MKKVLVIENEKVLLEGIVEILDSLDLSLIAAENGSIGVQLAQQHLPDLILCDIMMPKINGYTVLSILRQNPATATIPVIFISAKAEKSDIWQSRKLGADDYLTKPFTIAELSDAIAIQLESRTACQLVME
jgi:CheY-like chemotaxis protein